MTIEFWVRTIRLDGTGARKVAFGNVHVFGQVPDFFKFNARRLALPSSLELRGFHSGCRNANPHSFLLPLSFVGLTCRRVVTWTCAGVRLKRPDKAFDR